MQILYLIVFHVGMSESTGPHTLNVMSEGRWRVGSVGPRIKGVQLKIDKPDENGEGEVNSSKDCL